MVLPETATAAIACSVIVASAASLGILLPGKFGNDLSRSEELALRFLAGIGLLGLTLFLVGNWRWTKPVVWSILLIPLLVNAIASLALGKNVVFRNGAAWPRGRGSMWNVVWIAAMVPHAISAFAVPVGNVGNDAISYHLLGPVVWQRTEVVRPVLDHSHTAFPATIEMLYGAGMLLGNARVPGLLGVVLAIVLLVQVGGFAGMLGTQKGSIAGLAMSIAATMPVVIWSAEAGFIDIPYAAFCLAAARIAFSSVEARSFIVAGLFLGFAAGTKYTGLINIALVALVVLLCPATLLSYKTRLKYVCAAGVVALIICSPWYLRNFLMLGTPIYPPLPVLSRHLHVRAFPVDAAQAFEAYIRERGKGYGRSLFALLMLPLNFTYRPGGFHGAGGIGLAPLAFVPIAFRSIRRNRTSLAWLIWGTAFTIAWFFTQQEARFLIPVLAVAAALAALGADYLWNNTRSIVTQSLVTAILGFSIAYGILTDLHTNGERIESVFSTRAEARREMEIPVKDAFQYLNSSPDVSRVLVLNRYLPSYYLHKPYVKIRGQYGEEPIEGIEDTNSALNHIGHLHVTHVLDVRGLFGTDFELKEPASFMKLEYSSPNVRIYRVVMPW